MGPPRLRTAPSRPPGCSAQTGAQTGIQTLKDTKLKGISVFETSCYAALVLDGQWRW